MNENELNKPINPSSTSVNELGQIVGFAVENWIAPESPPRQPMRGRYCDLVPLDIENHAADLFAAFSLPGGELNWGYLPYGPFATLAEFRTWLESDTQGTDPMFFAIVDKQTGRASGVASYLRIAPAAGSIEVGHIHYSPLLQKTRAATEAMYLMMKQAFTMGYRRYEWKCNSLNQPSRDAAMRYGFSYEGIFRQALVVKGHNRDHAWYACIDREWPALQAAYETWLAPENFDSQGDQIQSLADLTRPVLVAIG